MNNNKIQKVSESIIRLPGVRSIGVIGDPGCEGLGTYNMKVYAGSLEESAKDDITLIVLWESWCPQEPGIIIRRSRSLRRF